MLKLMFFTAIGYSKTSERLSVIAFYVSVGLCRFHPNTKSAETQKYT